ncbi:MAG: IPT/TIG domain-containing protein [Verrucomicrobiota bacterium]
MAGAVALLAAAKPEATGLEIKAAIRHGVDQRPALKNKTVTGGRLNLAGALQALTNTSLPVIVVGSLPVANQTQPDDLIEIIFSLPMDRASVEAGFQISPPMNGAFEWTNNDQTLRFLHAEPFARFLFTTNYTCRILGSARDVSGQMLDGNFDRTSEGSPVDDFAWTFSLPLANDDFTNQVAIVGRESTIVGTTRYALPEPDEPLLTDAQLWAFSVWYRWTADATGWVTFDLTLSNKFDTTIGVLAGDRLDQLSVLGSNDNYANRTGSRVSFAAVQGTGYSIKVAAKYPGSIDDSMWGTFLLKWYATPPPGLTGSRFSPLSASPGSTVTLTGTNFTGATSVLFDGIGAAFSNAVNDDLDLNITAVVPPDATSGPITIVTPHGSVTSTNSFVFLPLPALAAALTTDGKLSLSWPNTFSGFVLESTPSLTPPNWQPGVEVPKTNNTRWELSSPLNSSERYFRLHKP